MLLMVTQNALKQQPQNLLAIKNPKYHTPEVEELLTADIICTKIFRNRRIVGFTFRVNKNYYHMPVSYMTKTTLYHLQSLDMNVSHLSSPHEIYDSQQLTTTAFIKTHKVMTTYATNHDIFLKYDTKELLLTGVLEFYHTNLTSIEGVLYIRTNIFSTKAIQLQSGKTIKQGLNENVILTIPTFLVLLKENSITSNAFHRLFTFDVDYQTMLNFRKTLAYSYIQQAIQTNCKVYKHTKQASDLFNNTPVYSVVR